ncbi:hypothetical protein JGU66_29465 [Myxococcaceae bacterium JPH2]|nr:hypothetical protein [Myxococcaceae bacterium JPH2]
MTDLVAPARAVSDAVEIAAPPNTPFVVQEPRCVKAPCLVCWLRARVAASPTTAGATFSTTPLQLNLVGVRSEDSLSNRFDDVMVVFFQLLPSSARAAFEAAVEEELRADMAARVEEMARSANGRFRTVACSQQGLWVVGLFTVTTDPGFEDSPEALEAQRAKYQHALADAEAKAKRLGAEEPALTRARAEARAARTALLTKVKKGMVPAAPVLPEAVGEIAAPTRDRLSLDAFLRAVEQRLGELRAAREVQRTHPSWVERTEAALAKKVEENEARKGHLPTFQYHKGWVEQGRAILPVGHYPDAYRFYLHKAGTPEGFPRATVALAVPAIEAGTRVYSVKYLCTAPERMLNPEFVERNHGEVTYLPNAILQLWPSDGAVRRYALGQASLVLVERTAVADGEPERDAFLELAADKKRTQLPMDTRVVVVAAIRGTNIHRAHPVSLSEDGWRLDGREARDGLEVNGWSEGCQTFADFYEFNGLIRLCAVSKRWLCSEREPSCVGAESCRRLVAGPGRRVSSEADLTLGERSLLSRFGNAFILRALSADCLKDAEALNRRLQRAQAERAELALTDEEQEKMQELSSRPPRDSGRAGKSASPLNESESSLLARLARKDASSKTPEVAGRLSQLDVEIRELTARREVLSDASTAALNDARLAELPGEIAAAEQDAQSRQSAISVLEAALCAVPAQGEKPMAVALRRKREASLRGLRAECDADLRKKQNLESELAERNTALRVTRPILQQKRDFLRERTQTFRADFLRTCDLQGTCKVRFPYTLIEVDAARMAALRQLFGDARNTPWSGQFVMEDGDP